MFNDFSVEETDWRLTEETVARAASAYMREAKAFDALSESFRAGTKVPTVSQLLDGHPPYRDSMVADIETWVARSRQIAGLPDALRDDLRDFETWPSPEGILRVHAAASAIVPNGFDDRATDNIVERAAWYGAIFGVPSLKTALFASRRDVDHRRMAYRFGLEFSGNSLGHASQWTARYQEDVSAEGHLILRRIGAMVDLVDWMREHHHEIVRFTKGKMPREQLFSLAVSPPTAAPPANPHPAFPTEAEHLQNDAAARQARATRLAEEGQTGVDDAGNVMDMDVYLAAEALGKKTISDILGTPRLRVIGPLTDVGTGDQKAFARGFSALANVGTPLVVAKDVAKIAAGLVETWPHAADVVHRILADVRDGEPIRMRPILLVGKPGCGKTSLLGSVARRLGCRTSSSRARPSPTGRSEERRRNGIPAERPRRCS